jgi:TRAP-type C4-dicarboxylate transport system permease small subunit
LIPAALGERGARALTRLNARLARLGMQACIAGLVAIVAVVAWQVFGRYVLNASPTWAENLALVLVLYVTLIGAAVGVRDAGHMGLDSLLASLPQRLRRAIDLAIHALVGTFGAFMAYNGWVLGASVASYKLANIGLPESVRYAPLAISGVLIVLFAIEHVVASLRGEGVEPSWP